MSQLQHCTASWRVLEVLQLRTGVRYFSDRGRMSQLPDPVPCYAMPGLRASASHARVDVYAGRSQPLIQVSDASSRVAGRTRNGVEGWQRVLAAALLASRAGWTGVRP